MIITQGNTRFISIYFYLSIPKESNIVIFFFSVLVARNARICQRVMYMACDSQINVEYQVTRMYRKWDIRRKYMVLPAIADSSC